MDSIKRFLKFMSKSDEHVLLFCTKDAEATQLSIGFMVLITGIFAFISSYFAISSTFKSEFGAIVIALIYCTAIMAFDREIVAASDKKAILIRIPFAILIGFVISFPLEMKLLDGRISAQVMKDVDERNQSAIEAIQRIGKMEKDQREDASNTIKMYEKRYDYLSQQFAEEARIITVGPRAKALEREKENVKILIDEKKKELQSYKLPNHLTEERKSLELRISKEKEAATDFLSKMEALDIITKKSTSAWWLSWILRAFFVTLEVVPVLLKLNMKYNEYHAYLNARREMNVAKIHAFTNLALNEIEQDPRAQVGMPEYTDQLEKLMEDPCHLTSPQLAIPKAPVTP